MSNEVQEAFRAGQAAQPRRDDILKAIMASLYHELPQGNVSQYLDQRERVKKALDALNVGSVS